MFADQAQGLRNKSKQDYQIRGPQNQADLLLKYQEIKKILNKNPSIKIIINTIQSNENLSKQLTKTLNQFGFSTDNIVINIDKSI